MNKVYIAHHGIFGQKWGRRRYQNKDGSLTPQGKLRYGRMSNDKLEKTLRKQVHKQRGEVHGGSNRWQTHRYIGENSKKEIEKFNNAKRQHENSADYKKYVNAMNKIWQDFESDKISIEDYEKKEKQIHDTLFEKAYDPKLDTTIRFSNGRQYVSEYLNGYGKNITTAYLKDLGYDNSTAKEFTERILKSRRKLIE